MWFATATFNHTDMEGEIITASHAAAREFLSRHATTTRSGTISDTGATAGQFEDAARALRTAPDGTDVEVTAGLYTYEITWADQNTVAA